MENKKIDGVSPRSKNQHLTKEKVMEYLPRGNKREVTDEVMKKIAGIEESGIDQGYGEEMLLTHMGVLRESKVTTEQYIDAVKYCCLVMGGLSSQRAWEIVFPDKAKEVRDRNDGVLSTSWSTMYAKTGIVTKLMAAMYVPVHLTYQPMNAWAIQKQYELARGIGAKPDDRVSPTVQQKAAETLYEMTKMPEDNTLQLKIGMDEETKNIQKSLFEQLSINAGLQMERLKKGESISDVQKLGVIAEAEIIDED